MITFALYGLLGGTARAMIGIAKAMKQKKFIFNHPRFWFTLVSSAIIGMVVGLLMAPDYKMALLAGYAGTDVLDAMVKARVKKW